MRSIINKLQFGDDAWTSAINYVEKVNLMSYRHSYEYNKKYNMNAQCENAREIRYWFNNLLWWFEML